MKKLLLCTAIAAAMTSPSFAQEATAPTGPFLGAPAAGSVLASDLIGARIYASEAAVDADEYAGVQEGWDDIGEVNDVILSPSGNVEAVLVDIGGFLGIGERKVAVDMSSLRFASDSATTDNPDDWFLVFNANRAALESAPAWGRDAVDAQTTAAEPAVTAEETSAPAVVADPAAASSSRDGYSVVGVTDVTSEQLTGANVYSPDDTSIGSVSDLVLGGDGVVTDVIVDVGGFLGIGAKPVALPLANLEILRQDGGDDLRVVVPMSKEQLEALPEHKS